MKTQAEGEAVTPAKSQLQEWRNNHNTKLSVKAERKTKVDNYRERKTRNKDMMYGDMERAKRHTHCIYQAEVLPTCKPPERC